MKIYPGKIFSPSSIYGTWDFFFPAGITTTRPRRYFVFFRYVKTEDPLHSTYTWMNDNPSPSAFSFPTLCPGKNMKEHEVFLKGELSEFSLAPQAISAHLWHCCDWIESLLGHHGVHRERCLVGFHSELWMIIPIEEQLFVVIGTFCEDQFQVMSDLVQIYIQTDIELLGWYVLLAVVGGFDVTSTKGEQQKRRWKENGGSFPKSTIPLER